MARAPALASLVVIPPSCCIAPPSWPKGTVSLIQQKLPELTLPFLKHGGIINSSWFQSITSMPSYRLFFKDTVDGEEEAIVATDEGGRRGTLDRVAEGGGG